MAYELQFGDGMNFYQYIQSNPTNGNDPNGLFSYFETLSVSANRVVLDASFKASSFAAANAVGLRVAGGLLAAINLYAFATYQEVQAIIVAQPNPVGILAADAVAIRLAINEVLATAGSIRALGAVSAETTALVTRAGQTVQGLAETGGQGGLYIVPGGTYSASERKAAEYVAKLGRNVVLRPPSGTRAAGGTSDLLVNGLTYDVLTPLTSNATRIVDRIAKKADQAVGIVVDLCQATVTARELGDVMARLSGKGVTTIREVLFLPK